MAEVTVRVPEELKRKMEQFPESDWSAVAREALWERAQQLSLLKAIALKSRLTEKDALALGRKINRAMARRRRDSPWV